MSSTTGQSNQGARGSWPHHSTRRASFAARWAAVALAGAALQGCPVYEDYCDSRSDCAPGYRCNPYTGDCELASYGPGPACAAPAECGPGETCGATRECLPGSCVFHGCVRGYTCGVVDGLHQCTLAEEGGGGPVASDAGAADASLPSDAGAAPPDAAPVDAAAADTGSDAAP